MQDCELLNLGDRPEKLIVTEIAVPPVPIRPSVIVGNSRTRCVFQFLRSCGYPYYSLVIQNNIETMNILVCCSNEDSITAILKSVVNTNSILKETLQTGGLFSKCFVRYLRAPHLSVYMFLNFFIALLFSL